MRRFALALVTLSAASLAAIQPQSLKLNDLMTEEEQRSAGVSRLTAVERAQLEVWLTNYTLKLYSNLARNPNLRPGELPILGEQHQYRQKTTSYKPTNKVLTVDEVYDDGASMRLGDGSIWRVFEGDQERAFQWDSGQRLAVYRSNNPQFPYRVVNMGTQEAISAAIEYGPDFVDSSSSDQRRDPSQRTIDANLNDGAELRMMDGSRWQISPWDRFKVKLWLPGEAIKVSRSGSIVYPYRLQNLETKENAEVKLIEAAPADQ